MTVEPTRRLTAEEYLARERAAETKSEFYAGELFAMTGASRRQNLVVANLLQVLGAQLWDRDAEVYASRMRVRIAETDSYAYPDVVAITGVPRFEDSEQDTLLNPTLLVEVLSATTADFDRGGKFEHYRTLPSLTEYLVMADDRTHAEQWMRRPDGRWRFIEEARLGAVLRLESVGCELRLADAYHRVLDR